MEPVDIGRLIGWNIGDGSISVRRDSAHLKFYFNLQEEHARDQALFLLRSLKLDKRVLNWTLHSENVWVIQTADRGIIDFFVHWGYTPQARKYLSAQVLQDETVLAGVLQGLFASDGWISVRGNAVRVGFRSVYQDLGYAVREALEGFGITCRLYRHKAGDRTFPGHVKSITKESIDLELRGRVSLSAFQDHVGFGWALDKQSRFDEAFGVYLVKAPITPRIGGKHALDD